MTRYDCKHLYATFIKETPSGRIRIVEVQFFRSKENDPWFLYARGSEPRALTGSYSPWKVTKGKGFMTVDHALLWLKKKGWGTAI